MASEGPNNPGTMADDAAVGTKAWVNPDNAKTSNNVFARATMSSSTYGNIVDYRVSIVKSDGNIGATNKGVGGNWPSPKSYVSYGGVADLWDEAWTAGDINDVDFGVVISAESVDTGAISHYLKATNFGFTIPAGATIDGILVEIEKRQVSAEPPPSAREFADVDHIRITVYYTEAVGTNMSVNIADVFKDIDSIQINIGDVWKDVTKIQINIGDVWKTVFG